MADHRATDAATDDTSEQAPEEVLDEQPEQQTPRPEPVLTRARYVQAVTAALPAIWALMAALGVQMSLDQPTALAGAIAAGGLVVAVVNWTWTWVQARRIRAQVTPSADPRAADGTQLVSLAHARAQTAEAEALAASTGRVRSVVIGQPTPTPWDQDVTIVSEAA